MVQVIVNQISLKIIILTKIKVKDHVCVMILYINWNKICKLEVLMYIIILFVQVLAGVEAQKFAEWDKKNKAYIENARNRAIARYN